MPFSKQTHFNMPTRLNQSKTSAQHGIGTDEPLRRTPYRPFPARTRRLNLLRPVAYPQSLSVMAILQQLRFASWELTLEYTRGRLEAGSAPGSFSCLKA